MPQTAGAVELRNSLQLKFGMELSATVVFDYPTVAALAEHIASNLPEPEQPAGYRAGSYQPTDCYCPPEVSHVSESHARTVFIVGVAGSIPGSHHTLSISNDSTTGKCGFRVGSMQYVLAKTSH